MSLNGDKLSINPAKPKCYRLREIPIAISKTDLLQNLYGFLRGHGSGDPVADDLRLTLAPSSAKHCMATLVLPQPPPKDFVYRVDDELIGITPIYEGDNAVVE